MKQVSFNNFSSELEDKAHKQKFPYTASLELTYGCNLRCAHCYNPTHKALPNELKTPDLCKVIDQIADLGCFNILFTGGEPLVRPDAFDLFHYARGRGLQVLIYTNATLIDEKVIEKLKKLRPTLVSVSVYGITKETYEAVTRIPGSYEKFMSGLKLLLETDLVLQFKMPIMTLNVHEFEVCREWFQSRNLTFSHATDITPRSDGNLDPLMVRLPVEKSAEFRAMFDKEDFELSGIPPSCHRSSTGEVFDCNCGVGSFAITPYGELNFCTLMHTPKYSLKTGNVKEGWKLLVSLVEKEEPTDQFECAHCDVAAYCSQGAVDSFLQTGKFDPCIPYHKEVAGKVKKILT